MRISLSIAFMVALGAAGALAASPRTGHGGGIGHGGGHPGTVGGPIIGGGKHWGGDSHPGRPYGGRHRYRAVGTSFVGGYAPPAYPVAVEALPVSRRRAVPDILPIAVLPPPATEPSRWQRSTYEPPRPMAKIIHIGQIEARRGPKAGMHRKHGGKRHHR